MKKTLFTLTILPILLTGCDSPRQGSSSYKNSSSNASTTTTSGASTDSKNTTTATTATTTTSTSTSTSVATGWENCPITTSTNNFTKNIPYFGYANICKNTLTPTKIRIQFLKEFRGDVLIIPTTSSAADTLESNIGRITPSGSYSPAKYIYDLEFSNLKSTDIKYFWIISAPVVVNYQLYLTVNIPYSNSTTKQYVQYQNTAENAFNHCLSAVSLNQTACLTRLNNMNGPFYLYSF